MARNIYGGGANTNFYGLRFEQETSLDNALRELGYDICGSMVYLNGTHIGVIGAKHDFIRKILNPLGIDMGILSKKLLPDEAFLI